MTLFLYFSDKVWKLQELEVPAMFSHVMIEAMRGGRDIGQPFGDLAIDDVEIATNCGGQSLVLILLLLIVIITVIITVIS